MSAVVRNQTGLYIYPSKIRLGIYLILSSLMVCLWLYAGLNIIPVVAGAVGVVFFGAIARVIILRLIHDKPLLTIDADGITDQAVFFGFGAIEWNDMDRIFTFNKKSGKQNERKLIILPNNVNRLIDKSLPISQITFHDNMKRYGGPIVLSEDSLPVKQEELITIITRYHKVEDIKR
jgi:hypothetical protein